MTDPAYQRYVHINLPHARTLIQRIGRSLDVLDAFGEGANGGASALHEAFQGLEASARPFDDDPPLEQALLAADAVAVRGRAMIALILKTPARSDRLGQLVRNLFECLGLPEEGATLSLQCGERPDSPLR